MDLLFARQPILDISDNVYGYELLYRDVGSTSYNCNDGDVATSNVIAAGFLSMGINEISGNKRAFINFTKNMILHKVATLFPKNQIVVEILEDIEPSEEIVEACRNLKEEGYTIALDDFIFKPGHEELIELADIIKVDFLLTDTEQERKNIVDKIKNGRKIFLAEKVETREDFKMAVKAGYTLFQGYYFSKPVIKSSKSISPLKTNHIKLVKYLRSKKEPEFDHISDIIENDVAFSYEILKIANKVQYYRGRRITSVRQAAVLLGLDELQKWAFITMYRKIGGSINEALLNLSVQRAKALELLADKIGLQERKLEFFTLGMMSLLDVLTGSSMKSLLSDLPLTEETKNILLGHYDNDILSICYKFIIAYEKGEWDLLFEYAQEYEVNIEDVAEAYCGSLLWTNAFSLN